VLAAGAAERMGTAKQLLPYGPGTVLGSVVAAAMQSQLDRVVVVTGFHADAVERMLGEDVTVVRNPDPSRGNRSSLLAGADAVADAAAVVLLLGDHPETEAGDIDAVVAAWRADHPLAAVCDFRGTVTHPFLLSRECLGEVRRLAGPKPLWRHLVEEPVHEVTRVPVDRAAPIDVDTPDDYRRLTGNDPLPPEAADP